MAFDFSLQNIFSDTSHGSRSQKKAARRAMYEAMTPLHRNVELTELTRQIEDWSEDMSYTLDWSLGEDLRADLLAARRDLEAVMRNKGEDCCLHRAKQLSAFMPVI